MKQIKHRDTGKVLFEYGETNLNWSSHDLLSAILWNAATTTRQEELAAFIGRKYEWCWDDYNKSFKHPQKKWAIGVLKEYVQESDGAPDMIRNAK